LNAASGWKSEKWLIGALFVRSPDSVYRANSLNDNHCSKHVDWKFLPNPVPNHASRMLLMPQAGVACAASLACKKGMLIVAPVRSGRWGRCADPTKIRT
jgi:hypothetical protein